MGWRYVIFGALAALPSDVAAPRKRTLRRAMAPVWLTLLPLVAAVVLAADA